ncbi:DUF4920 domain-containing protein [Flavobacterium sp. N1719]|uniref:DUF4920 domain-containing protein n=1 Tax=Flavobacterium sp. N1719 TaxID=2885633 RepID=UPI0022223D4C|nr:DUF4920 domain-containing protein [Flavobacterium sp. N1719]
MKKIGILLVAALLIVGVSISAQEKQKKTKKAQSAYNAEDYKLFGDKFEMKNVLSEKQMLKKYKGLKKGDTLTVVFKSKINSVCKKKGCWMRLDLGGKEESFVRFQDYGFFVPLNADNSEAIVKGKAFVDVVSVEEQKHYAKDGGKSKEEIAKITKPEITYAFTATGVYLKK